MFVPKSPLLGPSSSFFLQTLSLSFVIVHLKSHMSMASNVNHHTDCEEIQAKEHKLSRKIKTNMVVSEKKKKKKKMMTIMMMVQ